MGEAQHGSILKAGRKRTVLLAPSPKDPSKLCVVKRFHAPGALDRLRDGARARTEFEALAAAHEAGLRVPRPLEIRRTESGVELWLEHIEETVSLEDLVRGRAPWPRPSGLIAVELGRLLARVHSAGLDHEDLHAGNVLIDRAGRAWLVDLGGAHVRAELPTTRRMHDLVVSCAGVRERTSAHFRVRGLLAYLAALPESQRAALQRPSELVEVLEARARTHRREVTEHSARRYARESSVCRPFGEGRASGWVRRDLARDELVAITHELLARGAVQGRIVLHGHAPAVSESWAAFARLEEHALPAARPLVLLRKPRVIAVFQTTAHEPWPVVLAARGANVRRRRRLLHALGALAGALFDRGLALVELAPESVRVDEHDGVALAPPATLASIDPTDLGAALAPMLRLVGEIARDERAALAAGFAEAQRGGPRERASVRERLRHG